MSFESNFLPEPRIEDLDPLFRGSMIILGRLWLAQVQVDRYRTQRLELVSSDGKVPLLRFKRAKQEIAYQNDDLSLAASIMRCVAISFESIKMRPLLGLWQQEGKKLTQISLTDEPVQESANDRFAILRRGPEVFGLSSALEGEGIHKFVLFGNNLKPKVKHLLKHQDIVMEAVGEELEDRIFRQYQYQMESLNKSYGLGSSS